MNNLALYGLAGAGGVLLLMAVVKKKKKSFGMGTSQTVIASPRQYHSVGGDKTTAFLARFGMTMPQLMATAKSTGGSFLLGTNRIVNLPPGIADMGARPGAMGTVS
jgi:hypothetical protein